MSTTIEVLVMQLVVERQVHEIQMDVAADGTVSKDEVAEALKSFHWMQSHRPRRGSARTRGLASQVEGVTMEDHSERREELFG